MTQVLKAIYRSGTFILQTDYELPEGTEVELLVQFPHVISPPISDAEAKTWQVIDRAESLMNRFSLSHWDSMIVAACLEANVQTLYTEDFGYSTIDELAIINPFTSP